MDSYDQEQPVTQSEVDSDVNEDPGRERQLDESFEEWLRSARPGDETKEKRT